MVTSRHEPRPNYLIAFDGNFTPYEHLLLNLEEPYGEHIPINLWQTASHVGSTDTLQQVTKHCRLNNLRNILVWATQETFYSGQFKKHFSLDHFRNIVARTRLKHQKARREHLNWQKSISSSPNRIKSLILIIFIYIHTVATVTFHSNIMITVVI